MKNAQDLIYSFIEGEWKGRIKGMDRFVISDTFAVANGLVTGSSILTSCSSKRLKPFRFSLIGRLEEDNILDLHFSSENNQYYGFQRLKLIENRGIMRGNFTSFCRINKFFSQGGIELVKII